LGKSKGLLVPWVVGRAEAGGGAGAYERVYVRGHHIARGRGGKLL